MQKPFPAVRPIFGLFIRPQIINQLSYFFIKINDLCRSIKICNIADRSSPPGQTRGHKLFRQLLRPSSCLVHDWASRPCFHRQLAFCLQFTKTAFKKNIIHSKLQLLEQWQKAALIIKWQKKETVFAVSGDDSVWPSRKMPSHVLDTHLLRFVIIFCHWLYRLSWEDSPNERWLQQVLNCDRVACYGRRLCQAPSLIGLHESSFFFRKGILPGPRLQKPSHLLG